MKILNKKTIQIAIPILLFSFLFSDKKIKTKTEIIYNVKEKYDEQTLIPKNKSIYHYDINNKIIKENKYRCFEATGCHHNANLYWRYDWNGNLIEERRYTYSTLDIGDGPGEYEKPYKKIVYKYDFNNNLIEKSEERVYKDAYKYDANGNKKEYTRYAGKGSGQEGRVEEKKIYENISNSIVAKVYNGNGSFKQTDIEHYDNNGNLVSMKENGRMIKLNKYDSNNNLIEHIYRCERHEVYTYDANNKLLNLKKWKYKDFNCDDFSFKNSKNYDSQIKWKKSERIYKYDFNNNLIEELYNGPDYTSIFQNLIQEKIIYEYNFNNNISLISKFHMEEYFGEYKYILKEKTEFQYEYYN